VQLHPDRAGSSAACEEMLAEYAQILQRMKNGHTGAAAQVKAEGMLAQLPDLLRSIGVDPDELKKRLFNATRQAAVEVVDRACNLLFEKLK